MDSTSALIRSRKKGIVCGRLAFYLDWSLAPFFIPTTFTVSLSTPCRPRIPCPMRDSLPGQSIQFHPIPPGPGGPHYRLNSPCDVLGVQVFSPPPGRAAPCSQSNRVIHPGCPASSGWLSPQWAVVCRCCLAFRFGLPQASKVWARINSWGFPLVPSFNCLALGAQLAA